MNVKSISLFREIYSNLVKLGSREEIYYCGNLVNANDPIANLAILRYSKTTLSNDLNDFDKQLCP